jgi:hypothetical protein
MKTYGKFPCGPIRTEEDLKLQPEQLLPYYSMTQMGKAFDEEHGLDKETHILRMENRIRQLSSESKSS